MMTSPLRKLTSAYLIYCIAGEFSAAHWLRPYTWVRHWLFETGRTFIFLFGHWILVFFHSDIRSWRSSTPLWSRTIHPDGVHVQSQRSLKTCPTSLSAKEIVWERFVFSPNLLLKFSNWVSLPQFSSLSVVSVRSLTGLEQLIKTRDTQVSETVI